MSAAASAERAIQLCAARGHPAGRARVLGRLQLVDVLVGTDAGQRRAAADRGGRAGRRSAIGRSRRSRRSFLALLDGMEGRLDEARERMEDGRRALAEVGLHHWVTACPACSPRSSPCSPTDFELAERMLREVLDLPGTSADRWLQHHRPGGARPRAARARGATTTRSRSPRRSRPCRRRSTSTSRIRRREDPSARARLGRPARRGRKARPRGGRPRPPERDFLNLRGDTLVDLAEILRAPARPEEAAARSREAVDLYERKGNVVSAAKARALLGKPAL